MLWGMASVGENIKRLRERAGFKTQREFAKALAVEQPRLSDWENDRYGVPEVPNLLKIAKVLKVSLDDIIRGFDESYDDSRNQNKPHGVPKGGTIDGRAISNRTENSKEAVGNDLDVEARQQSVHVDPVVPAPDSLVGFLAGLPNDPLSTLISAAAAASRFQQSARMRRSVPSARAARSRSRKRPA